MFTAYVVTVSDSAYKGERIDASGPSAQKMLTESGYDVIGCLIVPDEIDQIEQTLKNLCDSSINLVVTSGGTGFSVRDVTPEATLNVIEKNAFGISEAIRANSMQFTPKAMLSRAVAGIRGNTLIINLPGSPRAVEESLGFILPVLSHGLEILDGSAHNCAR